MVIATSGTTAPWLSRTVPVSVAVLVCAPAIHVRVNSTHKTANERTIRLLARCLHCMLLSKKCANLFIFPSFPSTEGGEGADVGMKKISLRREASHKPVVNVR